MASADMRSRLQKIFFDTEKFYTEDAELAEAAAISREASEFYDADDYPELPAGREHRCRVNVTISRTYAAAMWEKFVHPERNVTVLNFASAVNPGGGVKTGSAAQEESLCRCSTLYPCLDQRRFRDAYYQVNREARNPVYTDACIWTPDVVICKTDETYPRRMAREAWRKVNVITCAAPNLRESVGNPFFKETGKPVHLSYREQYEIHKKRARHILQIAAAKGTDTLIAGAFGCGAFRNDPSAVAQAWQDAMKDYEMYFRRIEYAVFCFGRESVNYDAFRTIIHD